MAVENIVGQVVGGVIALKMIEQISPHKAGSKVKIKLKAKETKRKPVKRKVVKHKATKRKVRAKGKK